ncbi:MAG: hypothetical protein ACI4FZ_12845 [Lachnospiraceae bacterium]
MSLEIDVIGRKYECHMVLNERVTVIVGDSGVGKTIFAEAIQNRAQVYDVHLSDSRYTALRLVRESWDAVLSKDIDEHAYRVYVIDDEEFMYTKEFAALYEKIDNCYFVFISRLEINSRMKKWNTIPFSAKEIYEFKKNGKYHTIEPLYRYENPQMGKEPDKIIDICIAEDSKSGLEFFRHVFCQVDSTNGKDNLLHYIREKKDILAGKTVYLLVDISAAGFIVKRALDYLESIGACVWLSGDYESFEYMILKSNFFNITDEDIFNEDLLKYLSVERRCTALLSEITQNTPYAYRKGFLSQCYIKECCSVERKSACTKGMKGDKITRMLENTEFDFLLALRQKEREV